MVAEEQIPVTDGCPIWSRTRAFVVDSGVETTLKYVFRDASGKPINLMAEAGIGESESASEDDSPPTAVLRIREPLSCGSSTAPSGSAGDPIYDAAGAVSTTELGVVTADLPGRLLDRSGLYDAQFGVFFAGAPRPRYIRRAVLSIEQSNFTLEPSELARNFGPPTLTEIRQAMWDNDKIDNRLLKDVEYDPDQILTAMVRPVRMWNECIPLGVASHTSRSFPYREQWLRATSGLLMEASAARYRRNKLQGVKVDPLAKDELYMPVAKMLLDEYRVFVQTTKCAISANGAWGTVISDYHPGSDRGWGW